MAEISMCGRFGQREAPRYYADALSTHISAHLRALNDNSLPIMLPLGQHPWMIMHYNDELLFISMTWGYRTP
jgi:hypothetical protein